MPSIKLTKVHLALKSLLTTNSKCGGEFLCRRYKSDLLQISVQPQDLRFPLTFSAISEFMFCLHLQRVHLIRQIHGRKIGKVKSEKRIRNPIFGVDFFE